MSRLPVRARIAPVAFLIVFCFVVIGFLRADREMVRAERDRAVLRASEGAALVEAFLFRHSDWLRATGSSVVTYWEANWPAAPNIPALIDERARQGTAFEALWVIDSSGVVRGATALRAGVIVPPSGTVVARLERLIPGQRLATLEQQGGNKLSIVVGRDDHERRLFFLIPLRVRSKATVVGVLPVASITTLLRKRQNATTFGLLVQAPSGDTVLREVGQGATGRLQRVESAISTPSASTWTLTMLYSPSGRGVRIALWIVGLGAVIGLGIGLLLERREANRIADRSSELEHLSTELLRANRAKSEFLANVSHELRTPLNAIVGFVDLLRDGVYGALNSRQVGPVERIEASANHLRHLVDQVLDLAKMAAGRLEVHSEPLELRPFVFDVASEVEPLIAEKGLGFSLTVGATLPRVRTDPTHLRQILINLLGNAVKFTATGSISIRGKLVGTELRSGLPSVLNAATSRLVRSPRPDGLWISLQVVDSGIGIAEQDWDRIFEEFEQVNAGPRGDSIRRGTGLGLSISRRLARLIGGDITVESELGRGSVFTVWLPVDPADLRGGRASWSTPDGALSGHA